MLTRRTVDGSGHGWCDASYKSACGIWARVGRCFQPAAETLRHPHYCTGLVCNWCECNISVALAAIYLSVRGMPQHVVLSRTWHLTVTQLQQWNDSYSMTTQRELELTKLKDVLVLYFGKFSVRILVITSRSDLWEMYSYLGDYLLLVLHVYRALLHWKHTTERLRHWLSFSPWNHVVSTAPVCRTTDLHYITLENYL